jgi:fibronectin type 3 domain-containing protein
MHDHAIGYCVYRGLKSNDPSPELVNPIPFPDTSCTDDLVENDKKYYYVVQAISAKGITSIVSNEAPVTIPTGRQSHRSVSASAPLCRESANVK